MGSSKKSKQAANGGKVANSGGSRFAPCPVCGRNVAVALVHEHLNTCLTTPEKDATVVATARGESNQGTCGEDRIKKRGATEVNTKHNAADLLNGKPSSKKQKVVISLLKGGQVQSPDGELGEASGGGVVECSHLQRIENGAASSTGEEPGMGAKTTLESRSGNTGEGQSGLIVERKEASDCNLYDSAIFSSKAGPQHQNGVSESNLQRPETTGLAEAREGTGHLQQSPSSMVSLNLPTESGLGSVSENQDILVGVDSTEMLEENPKAVEKGTTKVIAPIFKKPNKVVYLIRHGNTMTNSGAAFRPFNIQDEIGSEATASGVAARTDSSGRIFDVPLSTLGFKQAAALQKKLPGLKAEVILVSPLTRALQTCQEALGSLQVPVEVTSRHAEHVACCGDVGRPPSVLAAEFLAFDLSRVQSVWWYSPAGAPNHALSGTFLSRESMVHLRERVQRFRAYLLQRPERTLVVIGHSTFFRELLGSKRRMAHCEIVQLRL
ncbi:hypothetical protein KFL_000480470 [Klebsormidium nitens]|uniref:UBZ4-type domain-containing protein n=1 Tax=Klebsormidium nitens TaxID=105231 RepID=A0A1Y1HUJ9_KLENI|nr:hypothetical protein KFL_000480470 [Klebsormidium nitens]|eukprot:GAQ80206.1 hypothetical protein KFL_000480470 [Klebsormidium nitens]